MAWKTCGVPLFFPFFFKVNLPNWFDDIASLSAQKNSVSSADCLSCTHKRGKDVSLWLWSFNEIFFRNQRIFRAVYRVKIAWRQNPFNRNKRDTYRVLLLGSEADAVEMSNSYVLHIANLFVQQLWLGRKSGHHYGWKVNGTNPSPCRLHVQVSLVKIPSSKFLQTAGAPVFRLSMCQ